MNETNWMFVVLAAGLLIATVTDLSKHRIPNWLTFSMFAIALIGHIAVEQWQGLLTGLGGALVGLLCFLPLHVFGAMGAGDVKLMTAVGTILGPKAALAGVLATIVFGGVIALIFITWRGGLSALWRRYRRMALMMAYRQPIYLAPVNGEAAGERFPYALAIACGSLFSLWFLT